MNREFKGADSSMYSMKKLLGLNKGLLAHRHCTGSLADFLLFGFSKRKRLVGQANTFSEQDLERLLGFIAAQSQAAGTQATVVMTFWPGIGVGEVEQVRLGDAFDVASPAEPEITLDLSRAIANRAREARLLARILIVGIENTMGRAAVIAGKEPCAMTHSHSAVAAGTLTSEVRLLPKCAPATNISIQLINAGIGALAKAFLRAPTFRNHPKK